MLEMETHNKTFACPECGTQVQLGAHTCPKCGKPLIPSMYANLLANTQESLDDKYEMVPGDLWCKKKVLREPVPDEKFIDNYTFGPGCWVYLCSRVFWPIALLGFAIDLIIRSLNYDRSFEQNIETRTGVPFDSSTQIALIVFAVISLAYAAMLIWLGKVARRKRWQRMKWNSFAHFRADENNWNRIGIIGWSLTAAFIILQVVASIMGVSSQ